MSVAHTLVLFLIASAFCASFEVLEGFDVILDEFQPTPVAVHDVSHLSKIEQQKKVEELFYKRRPVIVRGLTTIAQWPALKEWTQENLLERVDIMETVLVDNIHNHTYYYYDKAGPMLKENPDVKFLQPYTLATISSAEFKRRMKLGQPIYFSQDIQFVDETCDETLLDEITDWESFLPSSSKPTPNIWLGSPSVTTRMHYDSSDNFYIQINGIKKFTLVDPIEYKNMYMFPFLHPATRQSQVDPYHADYDLFPTMKHVTAEVAVLHPGDMLLLPSFWFHHVTAETFSVSVSTYLPTPQKAAVQRVIFRSNPIQRTLSREMRLCLGSLYIEMLASLIGRSGKELITTILSQSYSHFDRDPLLQGSSVYDSKLGRIPCDKCPSMEQEMVTDIKKSVEGVKANMENIYEPGVKEIAIIYLVEQIAFDVASTIREVSHYLLAMSQCPTPQVEQTK